MKIELWEGLTSEGPALGIRTCPLPSCCIASRTCREAGFQNPTPLSLGLPLVGPSLEVVELAMP